jgi:DNA polymerase III epsilon subunit-like protein
MSTWERLGVFDLETTGLDVTQSRIVTAFVGVLDATGAVIESHEWVADPGIEIPEAAARVHGYTTERARAEGRSAADVVPEIVERPDHPWFIGVQFHPELKSRPFAPHPLFASFVKAALQQSRLV